jgi:hypothetical protein
LVDVVGIHEINVSRLRRFLTGGTAASRKALSCMERKPRKSRNDAVEEDGVSPTGARPTPRQRPASRPASRNEPALETYEQPAARGGGDDDRSGLSRRPDSVGRPDSVERPATGRRTARDEP